MKLTKLILLFFFFFLLSFESNAQQAFKAGISFGMTTSQISGDGLGGWDKFGMTGGAFVSAPLSSKNGFRIGLNYADKGSRTKRDTLNFNTFAYRLRYIEVPVQYSFQNGPFTFLTGVYYGRLIKQDILANALTYDVIPAFRNYDVGITFGATLQMGDHFFIEGRFSSSMIPTRPSPNFANPNSYYEKGNYNQVLYFLIGRNF
ncbi:MAG: outer membrane beta-barrel protein [Flavobacteriales bacterium]